MINNNIFQPGWISTIVKFQPLPNLYGEIWTNMGNKKTYMGFIHGYTTIYGNMIWIIPIK